MLSTYVLDAMVIRVRVMRALYKVYSLWLIIALEADIPISIGLMEILAVLPSKLPIWNDMSNCAYYLCVLARELRFNVWFAPKKINWAVFV